MITQDMTFWLMILNVVSFGCVIGMYVLMRIVDRNHLRKIKELQTALDLALDPATLQRAFAEATRQFAENNMPPLPPLPHVRQPGRGR